MFPPRNVNKEKTHDRPMPVQPLHLPALHLPVLRLRPGLQVRR